MDGWTENPLDGCCWQTNRTTDRRMTDRLTQAFTDGWTDTHCWRIEDCWQRIEPHTYRKNAYKYYRGLGTPPVMICGTSQDGNKSEAGSKKNPSSNVKDTVSSSGQQWEIISTIVVCLWLFSCSPLHQTALHTFASLVAPMKVFLGFTKIFSLYKVTFNM